MGHFVCSILFNVLNDHLTKCYVYCTVKERDAVVLLREVFREHWAGEGFAKSFIRAFRPSKFDVHWKQFILSGSLSLGRELERPLRDIVSSSRGNIDPSGEQRRRGRLLSRMVAAQVDEDKENYVGDPVVYTSERAGGNWM